MDLDIINALMGHAEYLDDSYLRLDEEGEIAAAYLEAMPNVSVYQVESPEIKNLEQENEELRSRVKQLESQTDKINQLERENLDTKKEIMQLSSTVRSLVEKLENLAEA